MVMNKRIDNIYNIFKIDRGIFIVAVFGSKYKHNTDACVTLKGQKC